MTALSLGLWLALAAPPARAQAPTGSADAAAVPAAPADAATPPPVAAPPAPAPVASSVEPDQPQGLSEPPALAPPASDEALEALTAEISAGLRCPVCQGLSVNDSPAEGARSMKARVRELVALGYSREQIEDYFVDRYGTWVLLAPPATRQHWTVYLAPVAFLVVGVGLIFGLLRQRREPEGEPATEEAAREVARELQAADDELEPYRRRILAELGLGGEAA